jgi:hypothetical protein
MVRTFLNYPEVTAATDAIEYMAQSVVLVQGVPLCCDCSQAGWSLAPVARKSNCWPRRTIPGTWVAAWIVKRTDIHIHTFPIEALIVIGGASLIYGSLTGP